MRCGRKLKSLVSGPVLMASTYEHGNAPSCFIKGREFLDQLSEYQLPKNGCTPWNYLTSVAFGFTLMSLKVQNTV
jgi:hypothetical protein